MAEQTEKERVKRYIERFEDLKETREEKTRERYNFAAQFVLPQMLDWGDTSLEDKRKDSTATDAVVLKSDGMFGNMIAPHSTWFALRAENEELNEDPEILHWLQQFERTIYSALSRSNFYEEMPTFLRFGNGVGTVSVYVEENVEENVVRFSVRNPFEIYLQLDQWGDVEGVWRRFQLTDEQALDAFGEDKFDDSFKRSAEDNPDQKHWYLHVIEQNKDRDKSKIDKFNMEYKSLYFEEDGETVLSEGGYKSWPVPTWITEKKPGEGYGYCDTDTAKPLIKMVNAMMETLLTAAQKSVNPPKQAPAELRGKVKTNPGQTTWYEDPGRIVRDVPSVANFPVGFEEINQMREGIKSAYKVEHYLMLLNQQDGQMTAREVMERKQEKTTVTGATIGRFSKILNQIIDRVANIEVQAGRAPQPPEKILQLQGQRMRIDYLGPLAQAQKQIVEAQGILDSLELGAQLIQMYPEMFTESLDIINPEEVLKEIFENHGMPQEVLRDDREVQKIRQARRQQQQMAQNMAALEQLGKAASGLNAAPEDGSPMKEGLDVAQAMGGTQQQGA